LTWTMHVFFVIYRILTPRGDANCQLPGCHNADARFRAETQYRRPGSCSETHTQCKTKRTADHTCELAGKTIRLAAGTVRRTVRCLGAITKAARAGGEAHGKLLGHDKRGHTKLRDDPNGLPPGCGNESAPELRGAAHDRLLIHGSDDTPKLPDEARSRLPGHDDAIYGLQMRGREPRGEAGCLVTMAKDARAHCEQPSHDVENIACCVAATSNDT